VPPGGVVHHSNPVSGKQNFTEAFQNLSMGGINGEIPPELGFGLPPESTLSVPALLQMEALDTSFDNVQLEDQLLEDPYGVEFQNLIWNQNGVAGPMAGPPVSMPSFDDSRLSADYGSRKRTKFNTRLYKTELCRSWSELGYCPYGDSRCQFAHGKHELRPVIRHKKYKTVKCKNFLAGYCPYGSRCCFIHNEDGRAYENSVQDFSSVVEHNLLNHAPTAADIVGMGSATGQPAMRSGDENMLLVQPGTPLATQCAQQYIRMAASLMGNTSGNVHNPPAASAAAAANDLFLEKLSLDGAVPNTVTPLDMPQAPPDGRAPATE